MNILIERRQKAIADIRAKEADIVRRRKKNEQLLAEIAFERKQYEMYLEKLTGERTADLEKLGLLENQKQQMEDGLGRLWKVYLRTRSNRSKNWAFQCVGFFGIFVSACCRESCQRNIRGTAADNTPVLAAYDGFISYITAIRGYGNVVIMDHGNSDYTVYGVLQNISAEVGFFIKKGEEIGFTGVNGEGQSRFYFEVRHLLPDAPDIRKLISDLYGHQDVMTEPITPDGSARRYYRLKSASSSAVLCIYDNPEVNLRYIELSSLLYPLVNIPLIYSANRDITAYIQQDRGEYTMSRKLELLDPVCKNPLNLKALNLLILFHKEGGIKIKDKDGYEADTGIGRECLKLFSEYFVPLIGKERCRRE
ncbi:hypothetical protein CHS0354_035329 [Potamilus streckersoni]|uniref:M23ase beta-sheet core domain-containing protein n=1 Tax=Potamilus streckersoni TaxID=2493646 RepID=A0AAE0VN04_9BIVA|nr:hypothetical protein CHS0354_035329 [Potamilus streckersoni]